MKSGGFGRLVEPAVLGVTHVVGGFCRFECGVRVPMSLSFVYRGSITVHGTVPAVAPAGSNEPSGVSVRS